MASLSHTENANMSALVAAGTAPWLDQIRRGLLTSGELERLRDELSLRGVTSNPTIFEQAILGSTDYDEALRESAHEGLDALAIYEKIAVADVQDAADILRPVFEEHGDGFVSLEVAPDFAHDTAHTLAQARDYWQRLDRPNVMIKIPGTAEGVPAIEQAIYEGINVNVTLLFGVEQYAAIAEAYIKGLERRHAEGLPLDVHSVASFFVSRVDTEVDKRLEALKRTDLAGHRRDRQRARRIQALQADLPERAVRGARGRRGQGAAPVVGLDRDEEPGLLGNPLCRQSRRAGHRQHDADENASGGRGAGTHRARQRRPGPDAAARSARTGWDRHERRHEGAARSGDRGVRDANEQAPRRDRERAPGACSRAGRMRSPPRSRRSSRGPVAQRVRRAVDEQVARRVWEHDESLWGGPGTPEIADRLGWLISDAMLEQADELVAFAREIVGENFTDAVLLGMGGSSLAPEVLWRTFGAPADALDLHVLDSTDPDAILEVQSEIELENTLFVVSTKSGGTIETLSLFEHFYALTGGRASNSSRSPIPELARRARQAAQLPARFENDPNIGGRYSALSLFGLVPAALIGAPIHALLERAQIAEQACAHFDSSESNPGPWLGARDRRARAPGPRQAHLRQRRPGPSFGLWVEQLVAESTGKHGRGIVPVADEPLLDPDAYSKDRVFIQIRDEQRPDAVERDHGACAAGHPTITLTVNGAEDLGRLFFLFEFATAVAGWVLEINPFDQPNVAEAKEATKRVLGAGELPDAPVADAHSG